MKRILSPILLIVILLSGCQKKYHYKIKKDFRNEISTFEISSDKNYYVEAGNNLKIFKYGDFTNPIKTFEEKSIEKIKISEDNKYLIALTTDSLIQIFSLGEKIEKIKEFSGFNFDLNNGTLAILENKKISFYNLENNFSKKEFAFTQKISKLKFSSKGDYLLIAEEHTFYLLEMKTFKIILTTTTNLPIVDLCFKNDDKEFIVLTFDGFYIYNLKPKIYLKQKILSSSIEYWLNKCLYSKDDKFLVIKSHQKAFVVSTKNYDIIGIIDEDIIDFQAIEDDKIIIHTGTELQEYSLNDIYKSAEEFFINDNSHDFSFYKKFKFFKNNNDFVSHGFSLIYYEAGKLGYYSHTLEKFAFKYIWFFNNKNHFIQLSEDSSKLIIYKYSKNITHIIDNIYIETDSNKKILPSKSFITLDDNYFFLVYEANDEKILEIYQFNNTDCSYYEKELKAKDFIISPNGKYIAFNDTLYNFKDSLKPITRFNLQNGEFTENEKFFISHTNGDDKVIIASEKNNFKNYDTIKITTLSETKFDNKFLYVFYKNVLRIYKLNDPQEIYKEINFNKNSTISQITSNKKYLYVLTSGSKYQIFYFDKNQKLKFVKNYELKNLKQRYGDLNNKILDLKIIDANNIFLNIWVYNGCDDDNEILIFRKFHILEPNKILNTINYYPTEILELTDKDKAILVQKKGKNDYIYKILDLKKDEIIAQKEVSIDTNLYFNFNFISPKQNFIGLYADNFSGERILKITSVKNNFKTEKEFEDFIFYNFSSDDKYLALYNKKEITIYNTKNFEKYKKIISGFNYIDQISFEANNKYFVVWAGKSFELYDAKKNFKLIGTFTKKSSEIIFSNDGKYFVRKNKNFYSIYEIKKQEFEAKKFINIEEDIVTPGFLFTPDSKFFIAQTQSNGIKIYSLKKKKYVKEFSELGFLKTIRISAGGNFLIIRSTSGEVKIFSIKDNFQPIKKFEKISDIIFSEDDKMVLILKSKQLEIYTTEKEFELIQTIKINHNEYLQLEQISPNKNYFSVKESDYLIFSNEK